MPTATPRPAARMSAATNPAVAAHRQVGRLLGKTIFFVVGCQKSGTTWVQRLVHAHPNALCRGETAMALTLAPAITEIAKIYNHGIRYRNERFGDLPEDLSLDGLDAAYMFTAIAGRMLSKWLPPGEAGAAIRALGEKTPEHATTLEILEMGFPGCKVIHIVRDPRDVTVSGWHHNLKARGDEFQREYPTMSAYARTIMGTHWVGYNEKALAHAAQYPGQVHRIRFEDLLREPETTTASLFQFLGLNPDPSIVQQCLDASSLQKQKQDQATGQDVEGSWFFRQGKAGAWRDELDAASAVVIEQLGSSLMQKLGYAI